MKRRRYQNVVNAVCNTPWLILPEKLQQIRQLIAMRSQGVRLTAEQIRSRIGTPEPPRLTQQRQQIAVLNLFGTISHRMNFLSEYSGGTSTEMFGKVFDEAVADPNISAIVILADTPGGSVPGVMELSNKIYAARDQKRIITVIDPMMCSAGLWIGTAASEVIAVPSANQIGSVGVLLIHDDDSQAIAEAGVDRTIITTSEYKGELWQPLTESAKAYLKSQCQQIHTQFVAALARNRGVTVEHVESNFGRGRAMGAEQAMAAGIVDRIATLEEILAELGAEYEPSAGGDPTGIYPTVAANSPGTAKDSSMNPKILTRLIRSGLVEAGCTTEQYTAAVNKFFADRSLTVPTDGDAAIMAAMDTAIAMANGHPATPVVAAGTNTPSNPPANPSVNPGATTSSNPGMSMADAIASINLTSLSPQQRLDLQASLLPLLPTLSTAQVLDRINQAAVAASPSVGSGTVRGGAAEQDKFHAAARNAILVRAWNGNYPAQILDSRSQTMIVFSAGDAERDYGLQSLQKIAKRCLIHAGMPYEQVERLSAIDVANLAMGGNSAHLGFMASDGAAYNVSGMFGNILYDATNVLLRRSYNDARTTFNLWMRQGESLTDFKPVHKVIAGELGDPRAVPENGEFEEVTMTDGKESYKLVVWGETFSHSWQLVVNDKLGAFAEVGIKMGRAMRRKQNRLAYAVLKDNANMADGGALFNSTAVTSAGGHANLTTGAVTDYTAAFSTMAWQMKKQKGLDPTTSSALNIGPRFVVYPSKLDPTIKKQLGSQADPSAAQSGVINVYAGAYTPIEDEELGASSGGSDVAFYMAADPMDIDTIEYAFLQGLESPRIEQAVSFDRLAIRQRIYQAFAVKAIDFRGLQMHRGS